MNKFRQVGVLFFSTFAFVMSAHAEPVIQGTCVFNPGSNEGVLFITADDCQPYPKELPSFQLKKDSGVGIRKHGVDFTSKDLKQPFEIYPGTTSIVGGNEVYSFKLGYPAIIFKTTPVDGVNDLIFTGCKGIYMLGKTLTWKKIITLSYRFFNGHWMVITYADTYFETFLTQLIVKNDDGSVLHLAMHNDNKGYAMPFHFDQIGNTGKFNIIEKSDDGSIQTLSNHTCY